MAKLLHPTSISFGKEKIALILHIGEAEVDLTSLSDTAAQNGFDKKNEFHITIIGFKTGGAIQRALEYVSAEKRRSAMQQIQSLTARTDWGFTFLPQRYHISKEYTVRADGKTRMERRESYIQMVSVPALKDFYNTLNKTLNTRLEPPPPHVTLYTKGNKMGIGINSQEEFSKLNPKIIP